MEALRAADDLWWVDSEPEMDRPPFIASDERRMQVRAYNRWSRRLKGRAYPSIADLRDDAEGLGDHGVVLDFSAGPANPAVVYLGDALRAECGLSRDPMTVADVPPRSLLSRLTDHYLRIIANRAPIGFEAEFTSQRGLNTLYRGVLMPCSSDDVTIDFIYGVINWKEMADVETAAGLELEMGSVFAPAELPASGTETAPARPDAIDAARAAPALAYVPLASESDEFVMLLARRDPAGDMAIIARMPADQRLVESIARTL
jgi:hypothetical protein